MVLQVDEAVSEHAPQVSGVVLDVVGSTDVVDADQLVLRSFENDNNVELAKELFVFLGQNSSVGVYINHRIQCLRTDERCFSAILPKLIARSEELRREVEFSDRLGVQESHSFHAGQDDVLGDLSAEAVYASDQNL